MNTWSQRKKNESNKDLLTAFEQNIQETPSLAKPTGHGSEKQEEEKRLRGLHEEIKSDHELRRKTPKTTEEFCLWRKQHEKPVLNDFTRQLGRRRNTVSPLQQLVVSLRANQGLANFNTDLPQENRTEISTQKCGIKELIASGKLKERI